MKDPKKFREVMKTAIEATRKGKKGQHDDRNIVLTQPISDHKFSVKLLFSVKAFRSDRTYL